jgi:hypothetical protein
MVVTSMFIQLIFQCSVLKLISCYPLFIPTVRFAGSLFHQLEFGIHILSPFEVCVYPLVLCRCETWSLTLREECRLRVFKSRVLRRIFGPKKVKVTSECRRLYNE